MVKGDKEMFLVIKLLSVRRKTYYRKALCRDVDRLIKLHQDSKHVQLTVQYLMGYRQVQPNTLAAVQMARSQAAGFNSIDHWNLIAAKM